MRRHDSAGHHRLRMHQDCEAMSVANDELELEAWRFIANHRVRIKGGALTVSHARFIDDHASGLYHINTPAGCEGVYASESGATFGEAAIKLALALGMPCRTRCREEQSEPEGDASSSRSAPTVNRPAGASAPTSPATRRRRTGSTTAATSAAAATGATAGQRKNKRNS